MTRKCTTIKYLTEGITGTFSYDGKFIWFGSLYRCLTALSAQTGYIMPQEYEIYHIGPGDKKNIQLNNETIQ